MVNEMVRSRAFPVYLFGYEPRPPLGSPDGPMRSPPLAWVWEVAPSSHPESVAGRLRWPGMRGDATDPNGARSDGARDDGASTTDAPYGCSAARASVAWPGNRRWRPDPLAAPAEWARGTRTAAGSPRRPFAHRLPKSHRDHPRQTLGVDARPAAVPF